MSRCKVVSWSTSACLFLAGAAMLSSLTTIVRASDIVAPHSESGTIARLAIGQEAEGKLAGSGDSDAAAYHTYTVEVPVGTPELVVEMVAAGDLDLAIKHGSPIEEYGPGADWTLGDDSLSNSATLTVKNPQAGLWYIDVIHGLYSTDAIAYTLRVR